MNPPHFYSRKTEELVAGRISVPGATYFLTFVEKSRQPLLTESEVSRGIFRAIEELARGRDLPSVVTLIMPDHVHVLAVLGCRLSLARCVGKFKMLTRPILAAKGMKWQENFFEYRLRPEELLEAYARYIFLNPYRANLIALDKSWPHWRNYSAVRFGFEEMVERAGSVPAEWVREGLEGVRRQQD